MYCKNCGKEIPDDSRFCGGCGTNLISELYEEKGAELIPAKCTSCGGVLKEK